MGRDDKVSEKDSRNCKKASVHYGGCIFPIVYRNHIISRCQAQNEDAEEPEHVSSRWHRGPKRGTKKVDLAAYGVTAMRSFF